MTDDAADRPPHLAAGDAPPAPMVPHPIEGCTVHFRAHDRCHAALVIDILGENPLDPDFLVDLVFWVPRERRKDRFVDNRSIPGTQRFANDTEYAPVEENKNLTWHYPTRGCLPEVVLDVAGA